VLIDLERVKIKNALQNLAWTRITKFFEIPRVVSKRNQVTDWFFWVHCPVG